VPGAATIDFETLRFLDADNGWVGGNIGIWHRSGPGWTDLGLGLAGSNGTPRLAGDGTPTGGSPVTLALTRARPSSHAHLVIGLSRVDLPFKGGTFVPSPDYWVHLPTDASGSLTLAGAFPFGVPAGIDLYFQMWIEDAAALQGFAASNGLRVRSR
jgi:hypothetical protein